MSEIQNARITRTMLGSEDHGVFTFQLMLDFGGMVQGYGGYALDDFDKALDRRVGTAYGCEAIMRLLQVLEVESWEKLPGTFIRVRRNAMDLNGPLLAIGHPLKDRWLDMKALAAEFPDAVVRSGR